MPACKPLSPLPSGPGASMVGSTKHHASVCRGLVSFTPADPQVPSGQRCFAKANAGAAPLDIKQTTSGRDIFVRAAIAAACLATLSGCMTTGSKTKDKDKAQQTADAAEPAAPDVVMRSPGEQLAAELNAKAQAQAQKPGAYRDPQVRTVSGQQMVAQQSATGLFPNAPAAQVPPSTEPANIGGLITQPTAVNANRSSIYAAPPPIAVNPDGTLAPVSAYAAPALRNVYSLPPGTAAQQLQQQPNRPQPMMTTPANQSSESAMPQAAPRMASAAVTRPTSDATPSRILPAPGSKGRHLDSQEALMMARNLASGGKSTPANTMMPPASSGLTLPQGVTLPPGVTLTPGMEASLK